MYQGSTNKIVPYLQTVDLPCPKYHNPADYSKSISAFNKFPRTNQLFTIFVSVIELACGDYGYEHVNTMVDSMGNGEVLDWFNDPKKILKLEVLRQKYPLKAKTKSDHEGLEATSQFHQVKVLIRRGIIKGKRDATLTHLRIGVNIAIALMLGLLFINAGNEGSRVLDNYNLLFAILMHHMMTTLMLTVLTCKYN